MTSPKTIAALRIARTLKPAEVAMNEAAVRVFAMGTAILMARADGTVHPLEGQAAVDHLGDVTAHMFGVLRSLKAAHNELHSQADRHKVLGEGVLDESPEHNTPHASGQTRPAQSVAVA